MSYDTISSIPDLSNQQIGAAVKLNSWDFEGVSDPGLLWSAGHYSRSIIGAGTMADLYAFDAIAGQGFTFKSFGVLDPNLRVYDQFGNAILQNDESDDGGVFYGYNE